MLLAFTGKPKFLRYTFNGLSIAYVFCSIFLDFTILFDNGRLSNIWILWQVVAPVSKSTQRLEAINSGKGSQTPSRRNVNTLTKLLVVWDNGI